MSKKSQQALEKKIPVQNLSHPPNKKCNDANRYFIIEKIQKYLKCAQLCTLVPTCTHAGVSHLILVIAAFCYWKNSKIPQVPSSASPYWFSRWMCTRTRALTHVQDGIRCVRLILRTKPLWPFFSFFPPGKNENPQIQLHLASKSRKSTYVYIYFFLYIHAICDFGLPYSSSSQDKRIIAFEALASFPPFIKCTTAHASCFSLSACLHPLSVSNILFFYLCIVSSVYLPF